MAVNYFSNFKPPAKSKVMPTPTLDSPPSSKLTTFNPPVKSKEMPTITMNSTPSSKLTNPTMTSPIPNTVGSMGRKSPMDMAATLAKKFQPMTQPQPTNNFQPTSRLEGVYNDLASSTNTPFSYNPDSDQAFQAYAAQARQNLATNQANTNARLRATGQGKSSYSETVANQLGNQAAADINNAMIEKYLPMAYQQYQDRIGNMQNLYNTAYQQDVTRPITIAQQTGTYQDPEIMKLYTTVLQAKQNYANAKTPEERAAAHQAAESARQMIRNFGGNADLVGANVTYDKAAGNQGQFGIRTLGGQEMDLNNKNANMDAYFGMVDRTGNLGKGPSQNWGYLVPNANAGAQTIQGKQYGLQEQQVFSGLTTEQQQRDIATRDAAMQEWAMNGYATPNVAAAIGVPEGTPTSDQSYRDATQSLDQDKFTYAQMADAAAAQNQTQQQPDNISASTAGDLLSSTLQKQVGVDENGKPVYGSFTDPAKREQAFVDLYNNYGITGADMVTALTKAGYSAKEIQALKTEYPQVFQ